jgi:hypothetical protein
MGPRVDAAQEEVILEVEVELGANEAAVQPRQRPSSPSAIPRIISGVRDLMLIADVLCFALIPSVGTVCGRLLPGEKFGVMSKELSLERPIAVAARDGG